MSKPKLGRTTEIEDKNVKIDDGSFRCRATKEMGVGQISLHKREIVTISSRGFVKRTPMDRHVIQHSGGKGIIGMFIREEDAMRLLVAANPGDNVLFFTNNGNVLSVKCEEIPIDVDRSTKGTAIINLFPAAEGERVTAMVALTGFSPDEFLLMATELGEIKKTAMGNFSVVCKRKNGLIAMDLAPDDQLTAVCVAKDTDDAIMVTENGQSIRFAVSSLRTSSRTSGGVRGIQLEEGDKVVSVDVTNPDGYILVVTSEGSGKLSKIGDGNPTLNNSDSYKRQIRGGIGVKTFKVTEKTGVVAAARVVSLAHRLMIVTAEGLIMSTRVKEEKTSAARDEKMRGVRVSSRNTQGVHLIDLDEGDKVVAIAAYDISLP